MEEGKGMNNKERLMQKVMELCAKCCSYATGDGRGTVTAGDLRGRSRAENISMSRCICVGILISMGFTISSLAFALNRTAPAIRHMVELDRRYERTSLVYRIAQRQARTEARRAEEEGQTEEEENK